MLEFSVEPEMSVLRDNEQLDTLAENGVRFLSVPYAFFDQSESEIRKCVRDIEARGMKIDTCHTPFGSGNRQHSTCAEVDEVRQATISMWQYYLDRFALAGVRAAPLHTGGCMRADMPQRLRDNLTDTLQAILPHAHRSGVIIALENTFYHNPPHFCGMENLHLSDFPFLDDQCDVLQSFVTDFADSHIKTCFDVGHSNFLGRNVLTDFETLKSTIALFHIHDNLGDTDAHFTPGMGTVPFAELAVRISSLPSQTPLYLEVLGDPDAERKRQLHTVPVLLDILHAAKSAFNV